MGHTSPLHRRNQTALNQIHLSILKTKILMNNLVNSVRLMGNLGKKPEMKTFTNGGKVANCRLATSYIHKDKDGNRVEETDWHNLIIRGKQADVAEKYLEKGSQIAIEGQIRYRSYTDTAGAEKYITEILVTDFQMIGSKK